MNRTSKEHLITMAAPGGSERIMCHAGNASPIARAAVRALAQEAGRLLHRADDIRTNKHYGQWERKERLEALAPEALAALKKNIQPILNGREALRAEISAFNPVAAYTSSKPWQANMDLEIIRAFRELPGHEQSAIRYKILNDPHEAAINAELVEAFMRVPSILSPVNEAERQTLKIHLGRVFQADKLAGIEAKIADQQIADAAIKAFGHEVFSQSLEISPSVGALDYHLAATDGAPSFKTANVATPKDAPANDASADEGEAA